MVRDGFGARPLFEVVIAEWKGEPVGFALFFPNWSTWRGRAGLYLEDLFVRESHRGLGIGKALLVHLARIAVERGLRTLRLAGARLEPARHRLLRVAGRAPHGRVADHARRRRGAAPAGRDDLIAGSVRSVDGYWTIPLNGCVTWTGADEAWWWKSRQPSGVLRNEVRGLRDRDATSSSLPVVMFSAQPTRPMSPKHLDLRPASGSRGSTACSAKMPLPGLAHVVPAHQHVPAGMDAADPGLVQPDDAPWRRGPASPAHGRTARSPLAARRRRSWRSILAVPGLAGRRGGRIRPWPPSRSTRGPADTPLDRERATRPAPAGMRDAVSPADGRPLRASEPPLRRAGRRARSTPRARAFPAWSALTVREAGRVPPARPRGPGGAGRRARRASSRASRASRGRRPHRGQCFPALEALKHLAAHAEDVLREEPVESGCSLLAHKEGRLLRCRYGVVLVITPWNYPLSLPLVCVATAPHRRQHGRAEARARHDAGRPARSATLFRQAGLPPRRRERGRDRRRGGGRAGGRPARRQDRVHGQRGHGQEGDGVGGEEPDAGRAGAGRQGRGRRLPRRRPRPGRAAASSGARS